MHVQKLHNILFSLFLVDSFDVENPPQLTRPCVDPPRDLHILIVDDSRICRKIILEHIRRELLCSQYDNKIKIIFEECADGGDCVNLLKTGKVFEIICMDNMMEEMNGPEATRCIRLMGYVGMIIAITGNVFTEDIEEFLKSGANYVLPKPLDQAAFSRIFLAFLQAYSCSDGSD